MTEQLPHTHQFVSLGAGRCHYRVDGPATGRTLVLIHGATVPAWQFDRLIPLLNAAGLRTVRFDLYGHGYSDRPDIAHDYALYIRQSIELIDYLALGHDIHLVGHSLGAVIAARLAQLRPQHFSSVVMTAPMLNFMGDNPAAQLLRVPLLGELLMNGYVLPMLVRRRTRRYRTIGDGRYVKRFRDQFLVPGFGRSLLSLFRNHALADQRSAYTALNHLAIPVLLLSGGNDRIASPAHMKVLAESLPRAERHVIAAAEHALIFTHPDSIAEQIVAFTNRMS